MTCLPLLAVAALVLPLACAQCTLARSKEKCEELPSDCHWSSQTCLGGGTRLNVLFLAADDLRIQLGNDRVPGTHAMTTPHLDALANRSLFLRKAQVQQAVCGPTRASVLTSRYPDTTRVWDLYSYWRDVGGNFTTIPQLFKQQGYHTVGSGKIFHPGHASGAHGTVPGHSGNGDDAPYSWSGPFFHAPNKAYWSGKTRQPGCPECGNSWIAVSPDAERKKPLPGSQIADHAIAQLANFSERGIGRQTGSGSGSSQPFFLAAGFHKPHLPFVAPERFFQSYPMDEINLPVDQNAPTDMPRVAWSSYGELRAYLDIAALGNSGQPGDHLPTNVTKALRRAYYAAVTWTDYNIGRVLTALDKFGYTNNTVVSFWGDHGWQLGEHGEWCKHTNFDLATNAPMLVHIPGRTDHGIVSSTPTEFVDLMPTLVEAAMPGMTVPDCPSDTKHARDKWLCTQGKSLLPLIEEPNTPVRAAAYSQYPRGYVRPGEEHLFRMHEGTASSEIPGEGGTPSASQCLNSHCTMGYSMLTVFDGTEYRYTEWVDFNTVNEGAPDWTRVVGRELYNHASDPLENKNIARSADAELKSALSALLHDHPVSGVQANARERLATRGELEVDPNKWCSHPSDCAADEVCCLCNCAANDAAIGVFGCHCKSNGMPEPASQQTHCCGGESGFEAWCAKANTPSAANPKCNTTWSVFGVPTPASSFYKYGQHRRCVKQSKGCNAGYCDNSAPDAQHRGLCNRL